MQAVAEQLPTDQQEQFNRPTLYVVPDPVEQLPTTKEKQEEQKSFDMVASVRMLRYDYENFGDFLPETRERVLNEELSYLVEGVPRASRTSFVIKRRGTELVYFNQGEWQSYDGMVYTGLVVAQAEAKDDYKRQFLVDMRVEDVKKTLAIRQLEPGQRLSWTSPYRHDIARLYGDEFMDNCGLVSAREMGLAYQATCLEDGSILLETQTLDRSDAEAFKAVDEAIARNPNSDLDELVNIHDETLSRKFGENFYAGRADPKENAWETVLEQKPLIKYLLAELEEMAKKPLLYGHELEVASKKHIYGVWAAFSKVLEGKISFQEQSSPYKSSRKEVDVASIDLYVRQQVQRSFKEFMREGRVLVGCGGSIKILQGEDDIMNASGEEVFSSIFGRKSCPEIKDGQVTNCPHCRKRVKAIVPDRKTIYCSNDECKLAAPGIRKARKMRR